MWHGRLGHVTVLGHGRDGHATFDASTYEIRISIQCCRFCVSAGVGLLSREHTCFRQRLVPLARAGAERRLAREESAREMVAGGRESALDGQGRRDVIAHRDE